MLLKTEDNYTELDRRKTQEVRATLEILVALDFIFLADKNQSYGRRNNYDRSTPK
ncbi:hypothetical protein NIES4101_37740 [Calothrix sp. NIES-4101]|nr:hypothetical protein NIES4101_37740 [Calothrix sp. NIES-4101]